MSRWFYVIDKETGNPVVDIHGDARLHHKRSSAECQRFNNVGLRHVLKVVRLDIDDAALVPPPRRHPTGAPTP